MTAATPLLVVEGVDAAPAANAAPVLRGVSFTIAPGTCVALVGASGSGKTSLLRTIAGAVAPAAGRVLVEDRDLVTLTGGARRQARARIATVAQRHDLVEQLRVDKNVMAGALGRWTTFHALRFLIHARSEELDEARVALDAVGLADKVARPTAALSGGEQQRVAIARALVQAPALLLADEPVASLDPANAIAILELLTCLARARGMALLVSLHQPDLAARFADRVLEVGGGRVVERERTGA